MNYELGKLIRSRIFVAFFILIVIFNLRGYYLYCNSEMDGSSYTMVELQQKYRRVKDLSKEISIYEQMFENDTLDARKTVSGSVAKDLDMDYALQKRLNIIENYQEYVEKNGAKSKIFFKNGLYSGKDSFQYQLLLQSEKTYKKLENVTPKRGFYGGIELINSWKADGIMVFVIAIISGLLLITQEKRLGYVKLLRPLKKGGRYLYFAKWLSQMIVVAGATLILHAGTLAVTGGIFGLKGMGNPIQSVWGFELCPFIISIGGYLVINLLLKLFWNMVIGTIVMAVCIVMTRIWQIIFVNILLAAASIFMSQSSSLWIRACSIVHDMDGDIFFNTGILLDLFGKPFSEKLWLFIFGEVLLLVALIIGLHFYTAKDNTAVKQYALARPFRRGCRAKSIFSFELEKVFVRRFGIICLLLLLAVQIVEYVNYTDDTDTVYQEYAKVLAGHKNTAKDTFLDKEDRRFTAIYDQIAAYQDKYGDNEDVLDEFTAPLIRKLEPEQSFRKAQDQYNSLNYDELFVDVTPYEKMYNYYGMRTDIINTIKLFIVLIIVCSGLMAEEYESGMNQLIVSTGKRDRVNSGKYVSTVIFTVIAVAAAYIPRYFMISKVCQIGTLSAKMSNLLMFQKVPFNLSMGGLLAITQLIRLAIALAGAFLILFLSGKVKDMLYTLCISVAVIVVPLLISLMVFYP